MVARVDPKTVVPTDTTCSRRIVSIPAFDGRTAIRVADAVGNGTVADVEVDAYSAPKAEGGVAPGLLGVKIVELIAYTNSSSLEAEAGGFTVPAASLADGPTGTDDDVPF